VGLEEPADEVVVERDVGGMDQLTLVRSREVDRVVAERGLDRRAAVAECPVDVGDEHDVADAREQRAVILLTLFFGRRSLAPRRSRLQHTSLG
jgi:hypothetical protein